MKKLLTILVILISVNIISNGQCNANFTYAGNTDTITFTNLSSISNAHYYWNFGDGSGSTTANPIHIFPDDGEYLVTLYGVNTVTKCVSVFENWINVNKPDTVTCNLLLSHAIQKIQGLDYLVTTNLTTNCNGYNVSSGNSIQPGGGNTWLVNGWGSALLLNRLRAYKNTPTGQIIFKEYFKTVPYKYSSAKNYQNCSANFEIDVDYQANGALVTFTAMNKLATSYQWEIMGFGNPIYKTTSTTSHFYPVQGFPKNHDWLVVLRTNDINNSCRDTVTQSFIIRNSEVKLTTGIKKPMEHAFSYYPNPAENQLTLNFSSQGSNKSVTIYNLLGEKIITKTTTEQQSVLDISHLTPGLYLINIKTNNDKVTLQRFVKL